MFIAKIVIVMGAAVALFGTSLPARIFHAIGLWPFQNDGVNYLALIVGLCLLIGGLVGYRFEKK